MSPITARFACFEGCEVRHEVTREISACPTCGGLLSVVHDDVALRAKSAAEWKALFASRRSSPRELDRSGVWSKREWVMPGLPTEDVVSLGEGSTPLLSAKRLGAKLDIDRLQIKQCGTTHTGSFKDLGMTVLVSVVAHARRTGKLEARAIACASTGDTSAALAAYGAAAGLPVVVLLPKGLVTTAQLVQPLAHGAKVLALETDFDGCMRVIAELASRGAVYLANSKNPLRIEGQKTVALEIAEQLGWDIPDWIVLPSGNLGNAAALHAGFDLLARTGLTARVPRLLVAQAERANPLYRAYSSGATTVLPMRAEKTLASAIQIGNPVSAPRALRALAAMNGVVEHASENELARAAAEADRAGLFTCPHTAVALAALKKQRALGTISKTDHVVVISTAHGLKFTEFKLGYHDKTLDGVTSDLSNAPITLPADVDRVAEAIDRVTRS